MGLNSLENGLGSKKWGYGPNDSTLCDTSRVPELHGKVFPFQHNSHSAAVSCIALIVALFTRETRTM